MKNLKQITLILISVLAISCNSNSTKKEKTNEKVIAKENKIEVIDFYGTHRCVTCKAIQASAEYTLNQYYSDELKNGKITFQTINVDKEENFKIAENFEAAGTALFLNVIANGKETKIDLTDFAFENGNDQEKFSKELKQKLDTELSKI